MWSTLQHPHWSFYGSDDQIIKEQEKYFCKHFMVNASSKTFKLNFDMWTLKLGYNLKFK